ncbi:tyrosine-type recombinase/integrase [Actinomadura sp. KC345]|uniref:site-specific integrase n=1 Tax=Actinomadura sp. KC345 TaxID=2530371 RepID=UPI0014042D11|nr:tyrosine-type recombinase/integrase [Actinomadura sp. KC345]
MIKAQDIQFWQIRKRANRRKPWEMRWRVNSSQFSRSYLTKALAETYRSNLVAAARAGEVFSLATGEPASWERSTETFYSLARSYAAMRWADCPANSRKCTADQLVPVTLALLDPRKAKRNCPADALLRRALRSYAFIPPTWEQPIPDDVASALAWLADASRPVADLTDSEVIRDALSALALTLTGKRAAAKTLARRRGVWHTCMQYAVERKLLAVNPVTGVKGARARITDAVDPRAVPNLDQARRLLAGVAGLANGKRRGPHMAAFFAVLYYAGLRPAEARHLRADDLHLPASGWGTATLSGSTPDVGDKWTDDGDQYDRRALKHRPAGAVRIVPLPPVLVALLRTHLDRFGTAPDGRVFFDTAAGADFAPITNTMYGQLWQRARAVALTDSERTAGLAKRPYDLRHGCASLLLNSGVPATEVARRLGHSLTVLLSTYAHWFTGMEDEANRLIDAALSGSEPSGDGSGAGGLSTGQTLGTADA